MVTPTDRRLERVSLGAEEVVGYHLGGQPLIKQVNRPIKAPIEEYSLRVTNCDDHYSSKYRNCLPYCSKGTVINATLGRE